MTPIAFSLVNFLLLCALLYWLFGQAAAQFFHSRRMRVRKQMMSSVLTLRRARARAARSSEIYEGLPSDIEARKEAISESCDKECRRIMDEAHYKAKHILKSGERRALEERRHHASLLRERLMRAAFRIAEERIKKGLGPKVQRSYVDKGIEQLANLSGGRP